MFVLEVVYPTVCFGVKQHLNFLCVVMNIAIIGSGYVGLVTGTCFAEMGNEVICVDVDEAKVAMLRRGRMPIYEPDLEVLLRRNLGVGRLRFVTRLEEALEHARIVFLALPTPPGEDGEADLTYVLEVARSIARWINANPAAEHKVIVNKSTVPVGTAEKVTAIMEEAGVSDVDVVSNPEFLREGAAVDDFMKPARIILGASSDRAATMMRRLYEPFVRQGNPIMVMDPRSAELTKYAANAFLATRISFMNEMANLCDRVGADVDQIRMGIGSDARIGKHFLYAGIGYGGSCFPKDVQALLHTSHQYAYDFKVLSAVMDVNRHQYEVLLDRVREFFKDDIQGKVFAVWGLAFKPNTDDVREAPARHVIRALLAAGATVQAFDPEAMDTSRAVLGDTVAYAENAYAALEGADALVICTEWPEFRRPNFEKVKDLLRNSVIFDGRNVYNVSRMARKGFWYYSIGRPHIPPGRPSVCDGFSGMDYARHDRGHCDRAVAGLGPTGSDISDGAGGAADHGCDYAAGGVCRFC